MTEWGNPSPAECLERLRAEIGEGNYALRLVTAARHPYLRVTNRHAGQLTEDIYCDGFYYWWSWAERFASVTEVTDAAAQVTKVLRVRTAAAAAR